MGKHKYRGPKAPKRDDVFEGSVRGILEWLKSRSANEGGLSEDLKHVPDLGEGYCYLDDGRIINMHMPYTICMYI